jgi:hypothetical protein
MLIHGLIERNSRSTAMNSRNFCVFWQDMTLKLVWGLSVFKMWTLQGRRFVYLAILCSPNLSVETRRFASILVYFCETFTFYTLSWALNSSTCSSRLAKCVPGINPSGHFLMGLCGRRRLDQTRCWPSGYSLYSRVSFERRHPISENWRYHSSVAEG